MADVKKIIPFIFHFAAGIPVADLDKPLEYQFEKARKTGWSNDPLDNGGETMIDITLATYKTYCRKKGYPVPTGTSLKNITLDRWTDILKSMYWDQMLADQIVSQGVANICVDWLWSSGTGKIKNIQKVVGVTADGIVGPKTIAAINAANPVTLFTSIYNARVDFLNTLVRNNPTQKKWLNGWMRRLNAINGDGSFTIYGINIK